MPHQDPDGAPWAGRAGEAPVCGEEFAANGLSNCDIWRVVGSDVRAQLVRATGESERAAKPLRLRFFSTRKFTSTPATRLKSSTAPEGSRDRTIAPTSELPKRSWRTRATV